MENIKIKLFEACQTYVADRIGNAEEAISHAQSSANDETKSTAGDKHDTARAMMQLEVERGAKHLAEANKLKVSLSKINPEHSHDTAQFGSIVKTSIGNYFISISAGKIEIENEIWFAISAVSPIGQVLISLKKGDSAVFNGKRIEVLVVG